MLKLVSLTRTYRTSEIETVALRQVNLDIGQGEFLAIMGPSGCGKSTLLNILGLLDSPTEGQFYFLGEEIARAPERKLTLLRRAHVGFVFQSFNLIDELTVAENVEIALIYRGVGSAERQKRVAAALEQVGLPHRARHLPRQLSGGQQQRVAVARALVARPKLILAADAVFPRHVLGGSWASNSVTSSSRARGSSYHDRSTAMHAESQLHWCG